MDGRDQAQMWPVGEVLGWDCTLKTIINLLEQKSVLLWLWHMKKMSYDSNNTMRKK